MEMENSCNSQSKNFTYHDSPSDNLLDTAWQLVPGEVGCSTGLAFTAEFRGIITSTTVHMPEDTLEESGSRAGTSIITPSLGESLSFFGGSRGIRFDTLGEVLLNEVLDIVSTGESVKSLRMKNNLDCDIV